VDCNVLLMVMQHDQWGSVDQVQEHLLDADSVFGVQVVRDSEPSVHALRLAGDADAEIVADLEHAERAFAARAEAGRVEPVVLDHAQRVELEERASAATISESDGNNESAVHELPAHVVLAESVDRSDEQLHLFDERALEHNRRMAAFAVGVAALFAGGALVLLRTGVSPAAAAAAFALGLVLAVVLVRGKRRPVREDGGFDDVPEVALLNEQPDAVTPFAGSPHTADTARERLQAARAWSDACATIDRPILLVEPTEWLPDETLEAMLSSLPAGADVTIVEPVAADGGSSGD